MKKALRFLRPKKLRTLIEFNLTKGVYMKAIHGLFVVALGCLAAASAQAEDVVQVSSLIPYQSDEVANETVRKECNWNTTMPLNLAKESDGRVKVAEQNLDTITGKKLVLVATHLHTLGGGGWTGPKWLVLEGKLMQGNKLLGNFEVRRQTIHGSFRACGTLESLSEEITEDILKWLKKPGLNAKLGDAG
ncbi:hypothetical protein SFMTTN_1499 [Sulfuriferula multivorans]|uniref:Uncharacterized protein n=1 Tax=Sulfuriferula multivorans TaxID=1559896 RepID=A0A401JDE0_9PROT|nr:hypothetical protein [Sulfuriferula multivorans]GBL45688.1 hypothetical protein SFMTTN_1499 [Sulfuriferula multivorans]